MRENEKNEAAEAQPVKRPYNLREKKIKNAPYRDMIRAELADELYRGICYRWCFSEWWCW